MLGENKQAKYSFVGSLESYLQFLFKNDGFNKQELVISFFILLFHAVLSALIESYLFGGKKLTVERFFPQKSLLYNVSQYPAMDRSASLSHSVDCLLSANIGSIPT